MAWMAERCLLAKSCARAQSTAGKMSAVRGELTWGAEGPPFTGPMQPLGFVQESSWGGGLSYLGVSGSCLDLVLVRQLWVGGLDLGTSRGVSSLSLSAVLFLHRAAWCKGAACAWLWDCVCSCGPCGSDEEEG